MENNKSFSGAQKPTSKSLNQRKSDHVLACLDASVDRNHDSFAPYKIHYNALPEISLEDVSTEIEFAGKTIAAPLIISSMTGGIGLEFERINKNLALGAEALNIPLGLGSMKVMLSHKEAEASFRVREVAPDVIVISNLGLVSFNYGLQYADVDRIIDSIQPDVFGIHINALQEAIQEGGETDFRGLLDHLHEIVQRSALPVYVKECGGGIGVDGVRKIAAAGAQFVDLSGNDGTSWAAVEGKISQDGSLGELFKDFGLPTAWILEKLKAHALENTSIVASGGIRNGIQAMKALALGAQYVSVARPFLVAAMESADAVVSTGQRIIQELQTAMFLAGCDRLTQLNHSLFMDGPSVGLHVKDEGL